LNFFQLEQPNAAMIGEGLTVLTPQLVMMSVLRIGGDQDVIQKPN